MIDLHSGGFHNGVWGDFWPSRPRGLGRQETAAASAVAWRLWRDGLGEGKLNVPTFLKDEDLTIVSNFSQWVVFSGSWTFSVEYRELFWLAPSGFSIPMGLKLSAQGCAPRATLGKESEKSQPCKG